MNTSSSLLFIRKASLLALAIFANVVKAQTRCVGTREDCEVALGCSNVQRYGTYTNGDGWICDDYWAGSGWAVALWVILCLLMIVCCVWCCIAAAADPRPYYADPAVVYVKTVKTGSTQPQATTVSGHAGEATFAQEGTYAVSAPPVQGQHVQMTPVQGQHVQMTPQGQCAPTSPQSQPTVNVNVSTAPHGQTIAGQMQNDLEWQGIAVESDAAGPTSPRGSVGGASYPTIQRPGGA